MQTIDNLFTALLVGTDDFVRRTFLSVMGEKYESAHRGHTLWLSVLELRPDDDGQHAGERKRALCIIAYKPYLDEYYINFNHYYGDPVSNTVLDYSPYKNKACKGKPLSSLPYAKQVFKGSHAKLTNEKARLSPWREIKTNR